MDPWWELRQNKLTAMDARREKEGVDEFSQVQSKLFTPTTASKKKYEKERAKSVAKASKAISQNSNLYHLPF
jgi:hypothetical protein